MNIEWSHRSVYYLKITLNNSKPAIWRDILVSSTLTLEQLHYVIQAVMGWGNCHLHQFIAGNVLYTPNGEGENSDEYSFASNEERSSNYDRHEKEYTIAQLLTKEEDSIIYEYDLGDGWTHNIELKKILPADNIQPRCLKGEQACPPEDCGGIWGYMDMLEAMQDATNTEKDTFNPSHFDVDAVNNRLKNLFVGRSS